MTSMEHFGRCQMITSRLSSCSSTVCFSASGLGSPHSLPQLDCQQFMARDHVDAGGLVSYGVNLAENFHRAAAYVNKILKGANPGDLPVEFPTKLELVINDRAAKALGLIIPPSVLVRADEVIE